MIKNSLLGLLLILIILGLFLDIRLAFWVMLGLPISILGSFILFQFAGATLNMISLFAFLITLGVVIDDAVIIGETIYLKRKDGVSYLDSAIWGAKEMFMPVSFAILTNITSFLPLVFVPGTSGDLFFQIPAVVISVLIISFIECIFILPAHLAHKGKERRIWMILNKPQKSFSKFFNFFKDVVFKKIISFSIKFQYITIAFCLSLLILSFGLIGSGKIKFSFLPEVDLDNITCNVVLPLGSSQAQVDKIMNKIVSSAFKTAEKNGGREILTGVYATTHNNTIKVTSFLSEQREKSLGGTKFSQLWRENIPKILNIESLIISGRTGFGGSGSNIELEIIHPNSKIQEDISKLIVKKLEKIEGVIDLSDGIELGKKQISLTLNPQAQALNISSTYLAREIRSAFYGFEALRQQRGDDEYKVMLRFPKELRTKRASFDDILIKTPSGTFTDLQYLVKEKEERALSEIHRLQGRRIITLTADVNPNKANVNDILQELREKIIPEVKKKYPDFSYIFSGEEEARNESLEFLKKAFIFALIGIYALLAIPFNSYLQPITVMLSIPFGVIGAILGHWFLGYSISMISIIGIIGLVGIIVNDSLVLVVTINRMKKISKKSITDIAIDASLKRFRPIVLTSLTTFIGLLPMLAETSVQARFLIPMAISISFGILFATVIILALVPCIYIILDDFKKLFIQTPSPA